MLWCLDLKILLVRGLKAYYKIKDVLLRWREFMFTKNKLNMNLMFLSLLRIHQRFSVSAAPICPIDNGVGSLKMHAVY